jgi:hypothetical protein
MPKDPVDFSYCILMTITYLNFAVIENCIFRNWKAQYSQVFT